MTDLSPAAQAVLNTMHRSYDHEETRRALAAGVLRVIAEKLSHEIDAPKVDGSKYAGIWHSFDYLNAIAAELEQLDD